MVPRSQYPMINTAWSPAGRRRMGAFSRDHGSAVHHDQYGKWGGRTGCGQRERSAGLRCDATFESRRVRTTRDVVSCVRE
eukprot:338309-Pleurochrysis_carterae.AAC.2